MCARMHVCLCACASVCVHTQVHQDIHAHVYTCVCGSYPIQIYTKTGVVVRLRSTLLTFDLVGGVRATRVNKSPARLHTIVDGVRATRVQVYNAHDTSLPFVAAVLLLLHPCNVLRKFSVHALILWKVGIMHDVHGVCEWHCVALQCKVNKNKYE